MLPETVMMSNDQNSRPSVLITAGPTHEPIDAVRFLGNRSSGRMGVALANSAAARGWPTTLLLGPTHLEMPEHSHLTVKRFRTTADLEASLTELWPEHDLLIMAAAVADYRPIQGETQGKLRRGTGTMTLTLEATPDLLAGLAPLTRPDQIAIGFALEPAERLESSALDKLSRKRLDGIVANPLETMDAHGVDGTLYLADGTNRRPGQLVSKDAFADWLLDQLGILYAVHPSDRTRESDAIARDP